MNGKPNYPFFVISRKKIGHYGVKNWYVFARNEGMESCFLASERGPLSKVITRCKRAISWGYY